MKVRDLQKAMIGLNPDSDVVITDMDNSKAFAVHAFSDVRSANGHMSFGIMKSSALVSYVVTLPPLMR